MSPNPNKRFQEEIALVASASYRGFIALVAVADSHHPVVIDFSRADLPVLYQQLSVLLNTPCEPCGEGRHEDCLQHHGGEGCGCNQRSVHKKIFSDQVALYRQVQRGRG